MTIAIARERPAYAVFERRAGIALILLGTLFGLATYAVKSGLLFPTSGDALLFWLVVGDLAIALAFAAIIVIRLAITWSARRRGIAGSKLLARLLLMFGLIAVIPTLVVSIFSAALLDRGLNLWFQDRIAQAMESSRVVVQSYANESQKRIGADTLSLASALASQGLGDAGRLSQVLDRELPLRDITEALVIDRNGAVLARGGFSSAMEFGLAIAPEDFARADQGQVVVRLTPERDRLRALILLDAIAGTYLYAGRLVDTDLLEAVRNNEKAVSEYRRLEQERPSLQITVAATFLALALLLLLGAVWYAIIAAGQIVKPISRLATAATKIGAGDLSVRVKIGKRDDELAALSRTFNAMVAELQAQRKATWADIARRIAHEIKNPLTPIQLSAERLKRKYLKQIADDPETFTICIDTIIRQVGDIGRLVDEFSAFARMPAPVLRPEDPVALAGQALFLQQSANPAIAYSSVFPNRPIELVCDAGQFSRAVTNLLQNARDAIDGRHEEDRAANRPATPGQIRLAIRMAANAIVLSVEDNGKGLPVAGRERLTDPYVTTRAKGTGLGLAIVRKIMEDHDGRLELGDRPGGGAIVSLHFRTGSPPAPPVL